MRTRFLALIAVLPLWAPAPAAGAPQTRVELHALGKAPVAAGLAGFEKGVQLDDGQTVAWSRVLSLAFPGHRSQPTTEPTWRAWLNGGERIRGTFRGPALDGDGITLRVRGVGDVTIPLERIDAVESMVPRAGPCYGLLAAHDPVPDQDVAYDDRGDALRGTVIRVAKDHIEMEDGRENSHNVAWNKLRVLRLTNEPAQPLTAGWAEIEMLDGTRFAAIAAPTLSNGKVRFRTRSLQQEIQSELTQVSVIRWNGSAFVRASSLPFTAVVKTQSDDHPDVGVSDTLESLFRVRVDERAKCEESDVVCPLRIGGRSYRYGFAVHSFTALTIKLDQKYKSLQVGVGVDDEVLERPGHVGDASARVLGDGKVLWEKPSIKGGAGLTSVGPLDVSGVTVLVLEVGFGPDEIFTKDRVNWVDPILVRK